MPIVPELVAGPALLRSAHGDVLTTLHAESDFTLFFSRSRMSARPWRFVTIRHPRLVAALRQAVATKSGFEVIPWITQVIPRRTDEPPHVILLFPQSLKPFGVYLDQPPDSELGMLTLMNPGVRYVVTPEYKFHLEPGVCYGAERLPRGSG